MRLWDADQIRIETILEGRFPAWGGIQEARSERGIAYRVYPPRRINPRSLRAHVRLRQGYGVTSKVRPYIFMRGGDRNPVMRVYERIKCYDHFFFLAPQRSGRKFGEKGTTHLIISMA